MKSFKLFVFALLCSILIPAQVGENIPANGTVNPSAAFEIQSGSTPKGMLTPRMTTSDRLLIPSPADGLMVYDTDFKSFYYYKTAIAGPPVVAASWNRLNSEATGRLNFKRIKSTDALATVLADEKTAGGGSKYVLNTNTYYEINGTVNFDLPIELNNAYLVGLDANEDKLTKTGDLFVGTKGGTVKNVTITVTGGKVFSLGGTTAENLIIRDCIVAGCTNVGNISGYGLVFCSVIQYAGNTTGIVYNNINQLLLSNIGWFGNNAGTFETYTGTFNLIQKLGGFCDLTSGNFAVDVSSNPIITGDAVLESVVFTGDATGTKYVKKYTVGSYLNFNFNNRWNVRSSGIPIETDMVAVGDVNLDLPYGTGVTTSLTTGAAIKVGGTTVSNDFFRSSNGNADNRLTYLGNKKRYFTVNAVTSFRGTAANNTIYVFYIALNGVPVQRSKTYIFTVNASDVVAVPIQSILELSPNDYVEVFVQRYSGTSDMLTVSLSLFMK